MIFNSSSLFRLPKATKNQEYIKGLRNESPVAGKPYGIWPYGNNTHLANLVTNVNSN